MSWSEIKWNMPLGRGTGPYLILCLNESYSWAEGAGGLAVLYRHDYRRDGGGDIIPLRNWMVVPV